MFFLVLPICASAQSCFLRGDSNHDRTLDLSDAVFNLRYLFAQGEVPPCEDAADVNDDGEIGVSDVVYFLSFLFAGGKPPAPPFPVFEGDPTADSLSCLPEVPGAVTEGGSVLSGDITEDVTLTPDKTYRLVGTVYIKEGATLKIEAGVTIMGDSATRAALVVERGAKMEAVGTRTHPVVFTSDKAVGHRSPGDWSGIAIVGRAPNDVPGGEWEINGLPGVWAGGGDDPDPNDSSGRVSYVRVAFSGNAAFGSKKLTAIAFYSVGAGTQLDHIQAVYGNDDGIEWYGGTCSLKYGFSLAVEDEGFDCQ